MSTASKVLEVARREIGVREGRSGGFYNNRVKYNDWWVDVLGRESLYRTASWCAIFVSWVARHAGVPTSVIPNHAYTPAGEAWFKSRGLRVSTPRPGDILYVYYPRLGRTGHVGIVESYSNGYMTTIEGNTNTGHSRQGNGVYRLKRRLTSNIRVYRPRYGGSVAVPKTGASWDGKSYPGRNAFRLGVKHDAVTKLGERLVAHGYGGAYKVGPGPTFGQADKANVMAFQRAQGWRGSDADGYPGPETWKRLMAAPKSSLRPTPKPAPKGASRPTVSLSKVIEAARKDGARPQGGTTSGAEASVKLVEKALVAEGLMSSKYAHDGSFGTVTKTAYSKWQGKLGYKGRDADGIPGKTSLVKLGNKHGFQVVS